MLSAITLGKPASTSVGTSVSTALRRALVTAIARRAPDFTWLTVGGSAVHPIGIWLPSTAVTTGAAPL